MKKLTKEETTLLFTIKGESPLNYSYIKNDYWGISNKLLFLYPNLKRLTTINHDMIRLIQKLGIDPNPLSNALLNLNYKASRKNVDLENALFDELFNILTFATVRNDLPDYFEFDKSGLMDKTPSIEEELKDLTIREGLSFIKLYSWGTSKREDGSKYLFERYLENKVDLTFEEMLFIKNNFSNAYKNIDPDMIEETMKKDVILVDSFLEITCSCFRSPGNCSKWGLPYIEVYYGYNKKNLKLIYNELTSGDDYKQGFFKQFDSQDDLNAFIQDVITPHLNKSKGKGLEDAHEFKEYFLSNGIEDKCLDFN